MSRMSANKFRRYTGTAGFDIRQYGMKKESWRTRKEISKAEKEFLDKVWFFRHQISKQNAKNGKVSDDPQICAAAEATAKRIANAYGAVAEWYPQTSYELGFLNGTLSALRWVRGWHWGFLDS